MNEIIQDRKSCVQHFFTFWCQFRADNSPRHSSSNYPKNSDSKISEPKSGTSSAAFGPRSESVSSISSAAAAQVERLPALTRSISMHASSAPAKRTSVHTASKKLESIPSADITKSSRTHFSRYFNDWPSVKITEHCSTNSKLYTYLWYLWTSNEIWARLKGSKHDLTATESGITENKE